MSKRSKFVTPVGPGATVKGVSRLAGFLGLLVVLVPVHLIILATGRGNRFFLPCVFHRCFLRVLGFRVRAHGAMLASKPTFFVSNHSSYLDIPVLGSIIPGSFVAKSEVSGWPVMGFLARLQNTVFIERRRSHAATQRNVLRERLKKGENLILFPEGTSSDGARTLPFKSSLLSAVEEDPTAMIQPVSILCTGLYGFPMNKAWRPYYAWYGDMTLVGHFWDVFRLGNFTVDVVFHPPVAMKDFSDRKALTDYCYTQIARGVESCVKGRVEKEYA